MGITVFNKIEDIHTDKKTLSEISEVGRYYRHPDSACVSYAELVKNPLGELPLKDYKIAVIGGGAAGIVAIHELYRLTCSNKSEGEKKVNISITLYERDPDHFAVPRPMIRVIDIKNKKAGRVFCARSGTNGVERKEGKIVVIDEKQEDYSVYEIGAMRFPAIAGLTWHYAKLVFELDSELKPFPNPGKVPTEFLFGDRVDRYMGGEWLDPKSPTKKVFDYVREALFGPAEKSETNVKESFYPIGDEAPRKISAELQNEKTSQKRLEKIQKQWQEFANKYDDISLGSAVKQIITKYVNDLEPVAGISDVNGKINYYWELFGCFGFGTGGFKPLFNMSLVEMMRLILWDYSNEYLLPTGENVDFIRKIHEKSTNNNNNNFQVNFKSARVCDVCHEGDGDKRAIVFSYDKNSKPDCGPDLDYYDYVILAVPPQKLAAMASRVGFSNTARKIQFGDYGREYKDQIFARPPLILSEIHETPNVKIYNAINQVNMVHSSKVFGTIKREIYDEFAPKFKVKNKKDIVTAVVSDCGLGACYVIPMTLNSKLPSQLQLEKHAKYYSFLISYNWEDDTKRLQHHFQNYPINALDLKSNSPPEVQYEQHEKMINSIINHSVRDVKYCHDDRESKDPEYIYKRWWLGEIFGKKFTDKNIIDTLSYDWGTTSHTAGAFKLDPAGGYYNSNLCFRYHTHALNNKLNNRFFIAGDSYSHIGGWLEGAFMSAVNSVMGIIVAANGGGENGLKALSKSACNAITSLEPVA